MTSAFGQMAEALKKQLGIDSRLEVALRSVTDYISSPENEHYSAAFKSVKRTGASQLKTFVSIVYARAFLLLVSSRMSGRELFEDLGAKLSNPASLIGAYSAAQNALGGDFIGHLVVFSEVEARIDPTFAKIMDGAAELFLNHKPQGSARDPISDPQSMRDVLRDESESAWWRVPAALAFAMSVAPQPTAN
jgi:hypothetical protein